MGEILKHVGNVMIIDLMITASIRKCSCCAIRELSSATTQGSHSVLTTNQNGPMVQIAVHKYIDSLSHGVPFQSSPGPDADRQLADLRTPYPSLDDLQQSVDGCIIVS